jgi:hypothetical protein
LSAIERTIQYIGEVFLRNIVDRPMPFQDWVITQLVHIRGRSKWFRPSVEMRFFRREQIRMIAQDIPEEGRTGTDTSQHEKRIGTHQVFSLSFDFRVCPNRPFL